MGEAGRVSDEVTIKIPGTRDSFLLGAQQLVHQVQSDHHSHIGNESGKIGGKRILLLVLGQATADDGACLGLTPNA